MKIHGREMVESTAYGETTHVAEIGLFRLKAVEFCGGDAVAILGLSGNGIELANQTFDGSDPIEAARQWLESESARIAREMVEMAKWKPAVQVADTVGLGTIQVGGDGDFETIGTKLGTLPCPSQWAVEAISGNETVALGSWKQPSNLLAPGAIKAALHNSIEIGIVLEGLSESKEWRVIARRVS